MTRACIAILILVTAASARAQAPADDASKIAGAQFDKGRAAMKAGKYEEACAAFEQSERLDPQLGTLYNLAGCYEKLGKLVSAWASYRDLARRDTNAGRRDDAARHVQDLEPRLSKLVITLEPAVPGARVTTNGVEISALLGIATPVDLGSYAIAASARGYDAFATTAEVKDEGKTVTIVVTLHHTQAHDTELAPDKPSPARPVPPPPMPPPPVLPPPIEAGSAGGHHPRRTLAIGVIAAGGALIVGSLVAGKLADGKWSDVATTCGGHDTCPDDKLAAGNALVDQARTRANISTGLMIGGVVAAGAGIVLWLTAPQGATAPTTALQFAPRVGPGGIGVTFGGGF